MTQFPLRSGVCRVVCRPRRSEPRVVTVKAAVRFAKAAVSHGADPCKVVSSVRNAVGGACSCEREREDVLQGLDALSEAWGEFWQALFNFIAAMFGVRSWEEFDRLSKASWWQILWSRIRFVWAVNGIANAFWELIRAIRELKKISEEFRKASADLLVCLDRGSEDV